MLKVLDLFSGIGGFSLGLERTGGFKTIAFCEIDPYCQAVLARHWLGVPIHRDICELASDAIPDPDGIGRSGGICPERQHGDRLAQIGSAKEDQQTGRGWISGIGSLRSVDVICGGFPCQDISVAGKGAGLAGARSGLWCEYLRLIRELRPRYVIVENVSALLSRGLGTVLGDLAQIGYDAEWHCIPASYVGAPHRRDRVWIVAYPQRGGQQGSREPVDAINPAQEASRQTTEFRDGGRSDQWSIEPDVGRVAHGVPARVHRLRALGNAIVPQIAEMIGRAILQAEKS